MNSKVKQHNPMLRKQAGGTFLGLIFGLIIGLGIAVVVALMITKSPIPFVNKVAKQERPELSAGQAADPNKPLYGKDSNKEAPKELVKDPAKEADQSAVPPEAKKPEQAPAAKPAEPDRDKLAALIKEQAAAADKVAKADKADKADKAEKSEAAVDDKWTYFLQTGAFREQGDAENARAKLALLGFEAKVSERPSDNGSLYRVRIGPFNQSEAVNRIRTKLSDSGVDAAIVRVPK